MITGLDEVVSEIELMKKLSHSNTARLVEVINDPSADKLYIIMPLAEHGDLMEFDSANSIFRPNHNVRPRNQCPGKKSETDGCQYFDEQTIQKTVCSLVDALDYLHNEVGIVHRDIKPQNILVDDLGNAQLVDFGKSMELQANGGSDLTTSIAGSPAFLPPECCTFEDFDQKAYEMKQADIWALGITLYCMAYSKMPFDLSGSDFQLMENICMHNLNFSQEREISTEL
eukprot:CAMPEP_0170550878 /NCGR_PEP_ID=MMETSP0211-20121228/8888_1 /TAXON_ID=311385 /ORGANISM="Pseudokeronopsis sp., Strain OXSARD2" /LENGTH=227 /DNA_ID=CAMNT_0010857679 /DNA_START=238 /DNA_END=921 /DNA_ORIENTATION=+